MPRHEIIYSAKMGIGRFGNIMTEQVATEQQQPLHFVVYDTLFSWAAWVAGTTVLAPWVAGAALVCGGADR